MTTPTTPIRSDNHAGQWGLSALLIGGLVVIMFPIMVMSMFGAMVGAHGNDYLKPSDLDLGIAATYVATFGLAALALFALLCGFMGLLRGMSQRQPLGLTFGGIVTAAVAVVLAVVLIVIAIECVNWARDFKKERFDPNRPWKQWNLQPLP